MRPQVATADVTQLAEIRFCKPQVGGSTPLIGSWSYACNLKTGDTYKWSWYSRVVVSVHSTTKADKDRPKTRSQCRDGLVHSKAVQDFCLIQVHYRAVFCCVKGRVNGYILHMLFLWVDSDHILLL